MSRLVRRVLSVPIWGLFALLALSGLSWMALAYVLGAQDGDWIRKVTFGFLYELAKALFIATTAGTFIRVMLRSAEAEDSGATTEIECSYRTRVAAAATIEAAVTDPRTRHLYLSGISLRDILLTTGALHHVWDLISDRLKAEESRQVPLPERLKLRILLLDPVSPEGDFRSQIEHPSLPQGLERDVPLALAVIQLLLRELNSPHASSVLRVRLYHHGSFAFQFITDSTALVEQYTYRDQRSDTSMPLIRYPRLTAAYEQLLRSYEVVWKHARAADFDETPAGVGRGMRESRLIGIFRQEDRKKLADRQREVLPGTRAGDVIDIQALSARFYNREVDLESVTRNGGGGPKLRLLIANPTGRSAILRAVADKAAVEDVRQAVMDWTWVRHQNSDLYRDVHSAIARVQRLREEGCDIELRLSAADLSSALLLGRDRLFVEQYSYGRSKNFDGGVTLGGEYDVFEYERGSGGVRTSEERILESAFGMLWDSYSISAVEYVNRKLREECYFQEELKVLREQLGSEFPQSDITMVILAAGYGMRIVGDTEKVPSLKGKPKVLFPVDGKPLIEYLLEAAKGIHEIRRTVVVTNDRYFRELLDWRRRDPRWRDVKIISDGTSSNEERRGAIGALHFAVVREEIRGSVLVVGGDNFFDGSFRDAIDLYLKGDSGVLVVHDEGSVDRVAGRLGVVKVDASERIVDFEEKPDHPSSTLASTLCYVLSSADLRLLKAYTRGTGPFDNIGEFIRYVVVDRRRELRAFRFGGTWQDIGTFAEYQSLCGSLARTGSGGEVRSRPAFSGA